MLKNLYFHTKNLNIKMNILLLFVAVLTTGSVNCGLWDSVSKTFNIDGLTACGGSLQPATKECAEAQGSAFEPLNLRSYDQESCCQLNSFVACTKGKVDRECQRSSAGSAFFGQLDGLLADKCGKFVCNGTPQMSLLFGSVLFAVFGFLFLG